MYWLQVVHETNLLSQSEQYINRLRQISLVLLKQVFCMAFARARAKTGKRIAARIAMIAITTNSSIRVKPLRFIGHTSGN